MDSIRGGICRRNGKPIFAGITKENHLVGDGVEHVLPVAGVEGRCDKNSLKEGFFHKKEGKNEQMRD